MPLAADLARLDRDLVGRQLRQARAEARVDVFVEHLGAGIDVRIDIADAKSVSHRWSPSGQSASRRYRTARPPLPTKFPGKFAAFGAPRRPIAAGGGNPVAMPLSCGISLHRPLCSGGGFAYPVRQRRV
jgi:hypothetical protein